jgi:hypothetical protein
MLKATCPMKKELVLDKAAIVQIPMEEIAW